MSTKRTIRKSASSTPLVIRDADGDLHQQAAAISQWLNGGIDYANGTRAALGFMSQYIRSLTKPIDYASAPLDLLRDYAIHGYDFTIRAAALTEIERRILASVREKAE